uniref:Uncharacterized protein n=1 Tax=Oryza rufipogon TaxID=4529 RepID=A0A0E0QDI8_ORYRU
MAPRGPRTLATGVKNMRTPTNRDDQGNHLGRGTLANVTNLTAAEGLEVKVIDESIQLRYFHEELISFIKKLQNYNLQSLGARYKLGLNATHPACHQLR